MICDQAYVLNVKAFQETNAIVQLFSAKNGRYSAVFKNVYGQTKKSQQLRSCLQTASLLELSYPSSVASMPNIFNTDLVKNHTSVSSKNFLLLSYINELLLKLLPEYLAVNTVFDCYAQVLPNILQGHAVEKHLRQFEWVFLQEIDSHTDWYYCSDSGEEITLGKNYQFQLGVGFRKSFETDKEAILGAHIIAIRQHEFDNIDTLKAAKLIFRQLIKQLMGTKTLYSREAYLALYA